MDTSFWVALTDRRDDRHGDAAALLREHEHDELLTTDHVRGETWTHLRSRAGHAVAVAFLDTLEASERVRLAVIGEELEAEALAWLRRHDERPYSFVDATSFVLMRSLAVSQALTFDRDFTAAGFIRLERRL